MKARPRCWRLRGIAELTVRIHSPPAVSQQRTMRPPGRTAAEGRKPDSNRRSHLRQRCLSDALNEFDIPHHVEEDLDRAKIGRPSG
jgi:hypothetical protein